MDRSIPVPAAKILRFISSIEAPHGYDTIYGNNQGKLPKPITQMTLGQVQAAQPTWTKKYGSSAAGAYQIMRDTMDDPKTMKDLEGEMGLSGSELFDPDMQDRMAFHLLKRRGYQDFMSGRIGVTAFAKRLAQEWASFPVLAATQGAHRRLKRGQSYYAGDGTNKALVLPEEIEALLNGALDMGDAPVPTPASVRPAATESITETAIIAQVQARLFELGYTEVGSRQPDGTFDGKVGKMTKTAILAFRNEHDMPLVDYIDQDLRIAMLDAKPREMPTQRIEAKPSDVREQVPEAKAAWWTQAWAYVLGVPAAFGTFATGILDNLDGSRGYLEPVKKFAGDIPSWAWFAAVGIVAILIWQKSQQGQKASVEAFKSGERR